MNKLAMILALLMATASWTLGEEIPDAPDAPDAEETVEALEETTPPEPPADAKKPRAKPKPAPEPEIPAEEAPPVKKEKPTSIPVQEAPEAAVEKAPLSRFSLGLHLAYWNAKDLKDFELGGFLGSGIIGNIGLNDWLALQVRAGGYVAGYEERVFVPANGWFDTEIAMVMLPLEAGLVVSRPIGGPFQFYAGGGAGFYMFDGEYTTKQGRWKQTYDMKMDNEFGFFGLAGLRYQMADNLSFFLEAKYTVVETSLKDNVPGIVAGDPTGSFPLEKDLDMSGLAIQAGAMFTF